MVISVSPLGREMGYHLQLKARWEGVEIRKTPKVTWRNYAVLTTMYTFASSLTSSTCFAPTTCSRKYSHSLRAVKGFFSCFDAVILWLKCLVIAIGSGTQRGLSGMDLALNISSLLHICTICWHILWSWKSRNFSLSSSVTQTKCFNFIEWLNTVSWKSTWHVIKSQKCTFGFSEPFQPFILF